MHTRVGDGSRSSVTEQFRTPPLLLMLIQTGPSSSSATGGVAARFGPCLKPTQRCGAGWLQPKFFLLRAFQDWEDWTRLRGAVRAYAAQMAAVLAATLALLSAVAWKGFSLVRAAAA